ncbi:hypothetical protein [Pseudomonas canadensis]|uniref:hypothetical protein n=1 Tax=Pseudomonas canadensis TaxID=915099 RepID=UPI003BA17595
MDLKKIEESICKTGFKLEYEIASILRQEGWSLITNKYYLDDHEESVREIDILAYKCKVISNITVFTAILISCKKNESNSWALLARDIDIDDPNADWQPFKGYTNNASISYFFDKENWAESYYDRLLKTCPGIFKQPEFDIFAFQEIHKEKHTCQNDKNIFNSITSLMKAQAYELNGLYGNRAKDTRVFYQFNLISVIDSELIRVKFDKDIVAASTIEEDNYISKYILNKKTSTSRIKFLTAKKFPDSIKEYSKLHSENLLFIKELDNLFFKDILKNRERTNLLLSDFREKVKKYLRSPYYSVTQEALAVEKFSVGWSTKDNQAIIEVETSRKIISELNDDDACIKAAKKILSEVYRYEGDLYFEEDFVF